MDDDAFAGVLAGLNDAAAPGAFAAGAPGYEAPLGEDPTQDWFATTVEADAAPALDVGAGGYGGESDPRAWESEANPYREAALQQQALEAAAEQFRAVQAQQQLTNSINELADGDAERQSQLYAVIDQIASPLQYQAAELEQRAVGVEKSATALWVAVQSLLDERGIGQVRSMMDQLMSADSPELMERIAFGEREAMQRYGGQVAAKDREIAELRRHLGARAMATDRSFRGADAVDAASGYPSGNASGADIPEFDDWFDRVFDEHRGRWSA